MSAKAKRFVYTNSEGKRVLLKNIDIETLFHLRFFHNVSWHGEYDSVRKIECISAIFGISETIINEMRESIEYRESAISFMRSLGMDSRERNWDKILHEKLGSTYSKKPKGESKTRPQSSTTWTFTTESNFINFEHLSTHKFTGMISPEEINTFVGSDLIPGKKWRKIDQYREERSSDYEGLSKEQLAVRVSDLMDSYDTSKEKVEEVSIKFAESDRERKKIQRKLNDQYASYRELEDKVEELERNSYLGGDNPNDIISLINVLPNAMKKVIRNKFMVSAHPDKLQDSMSELSDDERQSVNRFFDFFQKLLKG